MKCVKKKIRDILKEILDIGLTTKYGMMTTANMSNASAQRYIHLLLNKHLVRKHMVKKMVHKGYKSRKDRIVYTITREGVITLFKYEKRGGLK